MQQPSNLAADLDTHLDSLRTSRPDARVELAPLLAERTARTPAGPDPRQSTRAVRLRARTHTPVDPAVVVRAPHMTPSNMLQIHNALQAESERLSAKLKLHPARASVGKAGKDPVAAAAAAFNAKIASLVDTGWLSRSSAPPWPGSSSPAWASLATHAKIRPGSRDGNNRSKPDGRQQRRLACRGPAAILRGMVLMAIPSVGSAERWT